jgi:hypothetical protein
VDHVADPRTMHCETDPMTCRGESYCACQCDKCKAAHAAGAAFYSSRPYERGLRALESIQPKPRTTVKRFALDLLKGEADVLPRLRK